MWTVEEEIVDALAELNLEPRQFKQLDEVAATSIIEVAKRKFLSGDSLYWWHNLRLTRQYYQYDFPSDYLIQHAPAGARYCYWIPQTEKMNLPVYEVEIQVIQRIMELTPSFEYYAIGLTIDWLLIQNDHGQLIVLGDKVR